jgi:hypothetical protein
MALLLDHSGRRPGGAARYWFSGVVANRIGEILPWGTMLVNISGSFVIVVFAAPTAPGGRLAATAHGRAREIRKNGRQQPACYSPEGQAGSTISPFGARLSLIICSAPAFGSIIRLNIGLVFLGGGLRQCGVWGLSGATDID